MYKVTDSDFLIPIFLQPNVLEVSDSVRSKCEVRKIKDLNHLRPNLKNLSRGLNLSRGSNIVGST